MGNYYINRAIELKSAIINWNREDVNDLKELLIELKACADSADVDVEQYIPSKIPTIWEIDTGIENVWAIDENSNALVGDDISKLEIIDYEDEVRELEEEYREQKQEEIDTLQEKIKSWDCKNIEYLYALIEELKDNCNEIDLDFCDYLPNIPTKWIPDELESYPVHAIDCNGLAIVGKDFDQIVELENLLGENRPKYVSNERINEKNGKKFLDSSYNYDLNQPTRDIRDLNINSARFNKFK